MLLWLFIAFVTWQHDMMVMYLFLKIDNLPWFSKGSHGLRPIDPYINQKLAKRLISIISCKSHSEHCKKVMPNLRIVIFLLQKGVRQYSMEQVWIHFEPWNVRYLRPLLRPQYQPPKTQPRLHNPLGLYQGLKSSSTGPQLGAKTAAIAIPKLTQWFKVHPVEIGMFSTWKVCQIS
jgi:hypothetical protein